MGYTCADRVGCPGRLKTAYKTGAYECSAPFDNDAQQCQVSLLFSQLSAKQVRVGLHIEMTEVSMLPAVVRRCTR